MVTHMEVKFICQIHFINLRVITLDIIVFNRVTFRDLPVKVSAKRFVLQNA